MHESPERSNNAVDDDEGALSNQQVPWVATSHGHGSLDLHATLGYNNPISQPPDTGDVQPNPEEEEELEVKSTGGDQDTTAAVSQISLRQNGVPPTIVLPNAVDEVDDASVKYRPISNTILPAEMSLSSKNHIEPMIEARPATTTMDVNRYATKKTIAQGMLDVALLTANASQLKYVLQLGPDKHPFYTLMLSLIIISIVFQVIVGILFLIIGGLSINEHHNQRTANILNDAITGLVFGITLINIILSGFGIRAQDEPLLNST